jgi:hypothetical protein
MVDGGSSDPFGHFPVLQEHCASIGLPGGVGPPTGPVRRNIRPHTGPIARQDSSWNY